jgi:hypothetical protein
VRRTGRVEVDLGYGVATVKPDDGGEWYCYSGVTRRGTAKAIAADGWRLLSGHEWVTDGSVNGSYRPVEQVIEERVDDRRERGAP